MRAGEAWMLKWTDFSFENRTVNVTPEKGSDPPTQDQRPPNSYDTQAAKGRDSPFGFSHRHFARYFRMQRSKVATQRKNERIIKITFRTLRYRKATLEYAKTKDILHVMKMLGHRNIQNTSLYTQLISFESNEFHSAPARHRPGRPETR